MRLAIVVNSGAGALDQEGCEERARQIREAFAGLRVQTEIFLCSPARLTRTARQLASRDFDAVVAAGGDGTVSSVAAGLAGTAMPLAVLPFGTLNHFARDIGMPNALEEAALAIRDGTTERIDVGEVNGRVFINNSSIGLYPEAVIERDDKRKRGMSKLPAMLLAALRVLWRFPLLAVCVETPEQTVATRTPFVFVGNNDYTTNIRALGRREHLARGHLCVHTIRTRGRLKMFWSMLRAMFGRVEAVPEFETQHVTEAQVIAKKRTIAVAFDGEVMRTATPLYYRIRPGALLVRRAPRAANTLAMGAAS